MLTAKDLFNLYRRDNDARFEDYKKKYAEVVDETEMARFLTYVIDWHVSMLEFRAERLKQTIEELDGMGQLNQAMMENVEHILHMKRLN